MTQQPAPWPRQALGSFLRTACAFVEKRHLVAAVKGLVRPETAALIDRPPMPFRWVDSHAIDDIEAALLQIGGTDLCLALGRELSVAIGGSLVQPVLRAAFLMFGETAETVLANLDRFFALPIRGITFTWTASGKGSGVVEARFEGPDVPDGALYVLRGSLDWVFTDLLRQPGTIGAPRVLVRNEKGTRAAFSVVYGPGRP